MMLKDIDYPGPSFDASAALAAALAAAGIIPARSAAALVVATRDGPARAGHRDTIDFYPASVAKLPLLVAAHAWQERGRLSSGAELDRALAAMIRESSNDATAYIIDCLTRTSSGPELSPAALSRWQARRWAINRYFRKGPWPGLAGCNLTNKMWADGPYGRDRQALVAGPDGRNRLTAGGIAELIWSLARHEVVSAGRSAAMLALLERSLDAASRAAQPYNQVYGYLGAGLPKGSHLWSKAGRTSETRHDAALVRLPSGRVFVLVAFTEGRAASENESTLPTLAESVVREIDR